MPEEESQSDNAVEGNITFKSTKEFFFFFFHSHGGSTRILIPKGTSEAPKLDLRTVLLTITKLIKHHLCLLSKAFMSPLNTEPLPQLFYHKVPLSYHIICSIASFDWRFTSYTTLQSYFFFTV